VKDRIALVEYLLNAGSLDDEWLLLSGPVNQNHIACEGDFAYITETLWSFGKKRYILDRLPSHGRHAGQSGLAEKLSGEKGFPSEDREWGSAEFQSAGPSTLLPRRGDNAKILFPYCNPREVTSLETVCYEKPEFSVHRSDETDIFCFVQQNRDNESQTLAQERSS
jgi:hypothetical protein